MMHGKLDLPWSFLHWLVIRRMQHTQPRVMSIAVNKLVKSLIKCSYVRAGRQMHVCMHGEYLAITHTYTVHACSFI